MLTSDSSWVAAVGALLVVGSVGVRAYTIFCSVATSLLSMFIPLAFMAFGFTARWASCFELAAAVEERKAFVTGVFHFSLDGVDDWPGSSFFYIFWLVHPRQGLCDGELVSALISAAIEVESSLDLLVPMCEGTTGMTKLVHQSFE